MWRGVDSRCPFWLKRSTKQLFLSPRSFVRPCLGARLCKTSEPRKSLPGGSALVRGSRWIPLPPPPLRHLWLPAAALQRLLPCPLLRRFPFERPFEGWLLVLLDRLAMALQANGLSARAWVLTRHPARSRLQGCVRVATWMATPILEWSFKQSCLTSIRCQWALGSGRQRRARDA